ncbi:14061_t:CDS:2, partial [Racocetra persica]
MLISGHNIELLDGDSATISEAWFLAVCNSINKKISNLRIFVISILGLQSSGKSTLLNALFGCKFAVSAGRCTKGIFMQFLFLERDLSNQLGVDAFILIDTEGLCAPENIGEPESEKKDQKLAKFAMRISNLTIINILGESTRELTKILQIVTKILMHLDMSPDILMVQHATENNATKSIDLEPKLQEILQGVLEIAKKENNKIGTRNLERLSKVNNKKLVKLFAPFKDGIAAYSPPSKQYHKDVVEFYNSIIDNCKNSQSKKKFADWFLLIKSYWDAASRENSSFEKIEETYDFIEFGKQVARLKGTIDMAFLKHKEFIETKIRSIVYKWLSNKDSSVNSVNLINSKCEKLIKTLNNIPEFKSQKCKEEANQTINNYIVSRREFITTKLENMLEGILIRNRFSIFIDRVLEKVLKAWKKLPNEKKLEEAANKIWKLLRDREYATMWSSTNFFKIYKYRIIPELSKIDAIRNVGLAGFSNDKLMELKQDINLVVEQMLRNIKKFNPRIREDGRNSIHVGSDNTPLSVLDQRKNEYVEIIKLRLQYGHSHIFKGHLTGVYLSRAVHQKAVDAEYRDRRDDVLSIPWIKNSETIRLKYFVELAEQVHNGDKDNAVQHFLKPQEKFDGVRQEILNCKNYEDIKKFVNNYMAQVDAIMKELDVKWNGHFQLEEESLPNLSDDELIKKRLGCTVPCFWCGALCWGERGHDNDSGETKIHHSSHQPAGLKGTRNMRTNELRAEACHNRLDVTQMHYNATIKKWGDAKTTDFKDWKFEPHYVTDFNEIMCWFFEMLHEDLAEKWNKKPAAEWDLETN